MKALSLFSGIGGLDLAAEAAGIETVAFCEREPFCQDVLHEHWPDVPIYDDVFALRGEQFETVDVIHGGFPCQPFSVAGRQRGQDDERYLWPEFSRLVGELRPRWVVAENVLGIMRLAADDVCKDLESLGYSVGIWSFEAASVGALHHRARVFFVAHSRCDGRQGSEHAKSCLAEKERGEATQSKSASGSSRYIPSSDAPEIVLKAYDGDGQDIHSRAGYVHHAASERWGNTEAGGGYRQPQPASDNGSGTFAQSRLGRMAYGFPIGVDLHTEPDIPRTAQGVKDRAARLKALGNAVVPAQAYPIFKAIVETGL